jgi:hypothetical protein
MGLKHAKYYKTMQNAQIIWGYNANHQQIGVQIGPELGWRLPGYVFTAVQPPPKFPSDGVRSRA